MNLRLGAPLLGLGLVLLLAIVPLVLVAFCSACSNGHDFHGDDIGACAACSIDVLAPRLSDVVASPRPTLARLESGLLLGHYSHYYSRLYSHLYLQTALLT